MNCDFEVEKVWLFTHTGTVFSIWQASLILFPPIETHDHLYNSSSKTGQDMCVCVCTTCTCKWQETFKG